MNQLVKTRKNDKGVTLIALVVTIIVLIILAGVSIAILTGDNGIINNAKQAQKSQIEGEVKDKVNLAVASAKMIAKQQSLKNAGFFAETNLKTYNDETETTAETYAEGDLIYKELKTSLGEGYSVHVENDGKRVIIHYETAAYKSAVNDDKAGITVRVTVSGNSFTIGSYVYNNKDNEFTGTVQESNPVENPPATTYEVTLNAKEGKFADESATKRIQQEAGKTITLPIATREGYYFDKWTINEDGTGTSYEEGKTITIENNINLYAIWKPEIKTVVSSSLTNLNTSAKVSAISGNNVTIDSSTLLTSSITGQFKIGDEVMLYVSNSNSVNSAGKFELFNVTEVNGNVLTLNDNISTSIFTNSNCQIVKVLTGDTVIVNTDVTVTASAYNGNCGGIIAIDADKVTINGKLNASKCGYDSSNTAPNNGGQQSSGNYSHAGGSNRYKGGNGGKNYQGYTGAASNAVGISTDILTNKQMTFGGGNNNTKGGGIVFIQTNRLEIGSQYAVSANGQGGTGLTGGGAGGSICINAKEIVFTTSNKDYFVGANGGSGSTESKTSSGWPVTNGADGTNIVGGTAPNSNSGKTGGKGYLSNGGGGAQYGSAGKNATATAGGTGGDASYANGWNAGGGGGGRRLCNIVYRYKY